MNNSIYKIAVCDDSQADIDYITILVKEWAKDKTIQIKAYPSAEAFMFNYALVLPNKIPEFIIADSHSFTSRG